LKIEKISRNKIFFYDGRVIDISKDIEYSFNLKADKELSKEEYEKIIFQASLMKAYFLLSRRDYSKKDLEKKLILKYGEKNIIKNAIDRLEEKGYLNDFDYAKTLIRGKKKDGLKKLRFDLMKKGISREVIEDVFRDVEVDEKEMIRQLLPKLVKKEREKKVAYLARRGFSFDDIFLVLNED